MPGTNKHTIIRNTGGSGDMLKSVYDVNDSGYVDSAHKILLPFINKLGSTLTKGTIVYLNSSSSSANYPEALKSNASTEATSSKTIGAVYEDVANSATGYIVTNGEVHNLDTSSYSVGTSLWLSTTDGQVTTTRPTAPNHAVYIGKVTRSQVANGRIHYSIMNGYELDELHDILITSATDGQVIQQEGGLWKNKYTWEYLATNWSVEPTLNTTLAGGEVLNYTLNGTTRYRFVPTTYDPTQDAFYATFDGTTLSNLVAKRG